MGMTTIISWEKTEAGPSRDKGKPSFHRLISLSFFACSIAFTSACGGGGGGGGGGGDAGSGNGGGGETPTCAGSQALNAAKSACIDCPQGQYPNSDRTACVSSCPSGQIKPTDKPTCETLASCTGAQAPSPATNVCVNCSGGQYPNSGNTACVSSCEPGELKPDNKPTCETEDKLHEPANTKPGRPTPAWIQGSAQKARYLILPLIVAALLPAPAAQPPASL